MADHTFNVRIISPKQVIFQGFASSVSSKNSAGPFDILAEHANFITVIENHPIIIRPVGKKPVVFTFPLAIIYTSQNTVNIYTQISQLNQIEQQTNGPENSGTPTH